MAPRNCSVFGCLHTSALNPTLTFFTLPVDVERRMQWLRLIDREDLVDRAIKHYQVCEIHFKTRDILFTSNRKMLKRNTLPSLNLPNPHAEDDTLAAVEGSQKENMEMQMTSDSANHAAGGPILNCNDQTTAVLSENNPLKRKLKLDMIECEKRRKMQEKDESEKNVLLKLCDRFLTENLAKLVKAQIDLKYSSKENKDNLQYKMFCLNLYYASPEAYRLLEKTLHLPCNTTLNKLNIPISTNINDDLMSVLKIKVENMTEAEKNCCIVVGATCLKANLVYVKKYDKIMGFHEVDGVQSPLPAKHALVVIVRGISVNWMQPIGYAFLAERRSSDDVSLWIDKILIKLFQIGLKIRAFVSELGSDFIDAAKKRSVSTDRPYFYVDYMKIYYIFDTPHLIKLIRNNLMTYDFHLQDNTVAKYEHIVQFYEHDKSKNYKLADKLTNCHISPTSIKKMNVKYAAQLLSRSVATGISTYIDFNVIDESGRGTVQFIQLINDLFDTLNSSTLLHSYRFKKAFCGKYSQIEFLNQMIDFFETLKLTDRKNGSDGTEAVEFIDGFITTIKSIMYLFEDLKQEGFEYILTRRLNQDVLQKLFGRIRSKSGMAIEQTTWQFTSAFRKLCFADILRAPQKGNSGDNLSKVVTVLNHFKDSNDHNGQIEQALVSVKLEEQEEFCEIMNADYSQMEIPEKKSLFYVCSALLRKCAEKHSNCEALKSYMDVNQESDNLSAQSRYLRYGEFAKEGTSNLLVVPPDDFVNYIEKMEQIFKSEFERTHLTTQIGRFIYEQLQTIDFISPPPCQCFPKTYLQQLFIRMRLYYTCKFNNIAFRTCRKRRKDFLVSNL